MTIIKSISSVLTLLLFSLIIGVSVQAQPPNRDNARQIGNIPRLSESELNQLIQQVENGGDTFRVSLTDAFCQRPYDRTRSEGNMNDALRGFKKATDQLRIRFDARQLVDGRRPTPARPGQAPRHFHARQPAYRPRQERLVHITRGSKRPWQRV